MSPIEATLAALGFKKHHFVQGRSHVRDLFKTQVCGIYVLHFENGEYYVGQSVNVVSRFAAHAKNHPDIQQLSFKVVARDDLDSEEKRVTKALENNGRLLRNIHNTTYSFGKSSLDDLMPPFVQEQFYTDMNFFDMDGQRQDEPNIRRHYHKHYLKFISLPESDNIAHALAFYVTQTIPAPKRTEMIFWNVSCMTGGDKYPLVRINIGMQMTVEMLYQNNQPVFYVYLTRELLSEMLPFPVDNIGEKVRIFTIPNMKVNENDVDLQISLQKSFLKAGGEDQLILGTVNPYNLIRTTILLQPIMRIFNLGLMQKNKCKWGQNHCLDLADHLFIEPIRLYEDNLN